MNAEMKRLYRGCRGKKHFETRRRAKQANRYHYAIYKCSDCGGYHYTKRGTKKAAQ